MHKQLFFSSLLLLHLPTLRASHLGNATFLDPIEGPRQITFVKKNNFAVVEGDILLGKLSELSKQSAVITLKLGGSRWPDGIVPFEVDENLPFKNKLSVFQAIALWQEKSNLEFIELNSKNRNQFGSYISFIPAEGTTCSSYVGRQGGKQEINLSPRCTTMNTVHEIGHAVGLWHEQSRADRTNYITILFENIDEDHLYNFDQHLTDGKDHGDYDYDSIMHYGPFAFSKNGQKTIIPLVENIKIGQRDHLSKGDIAAVNAMYPQS